MGFSIDDIISTDHPGKSCPSPRLSTYVVPTSWQVPSSVNNLYHFHHQSVLQYFHHHQRFPDSQATVFLLNSFRKPKRNRTAFTPTQLMRLEDAFEKNHYIVGEERKALAKHLNLSETKVKVWYQNRRTKHKRLITEDDCSSGNELEHHRDAWETADTTTKLDNDSSWNHEDERGDHSYEDS